MRVCVYAFWGLIMNMLSPKSFLFSLSVIAVTSILGISPAEAVTGFAASDGTYNDKIAVTWSGGTSINTTSQVWRAMSPTGIKIHLGDAVVTKAGNGSFDDSEVAPEKLYYYWVRECSTLTPTCGSYEGGDDGYRRLDVPTSVSATQGVHTNKVVVSWSGVTGADPYTLDYQVHRSVTDGGVKTLLGTTGTTSFSDFTVPTPGTGYFYYVTACIGGGGGCGESSSSALGWQGLAAPASVNATDGTSTTAVTISWSAVTGAAGYQIWRRLDAASSLFATRASPTPVPVDDTGVGAGVDAHYKVRAFSYPNPDYPSAAHLGLFSDEDTGWKAYTAPSLVEATYKTDVDKVVVTWSAVSNAQLYQVYRSETPEGAQTKIGSVSFVSPREFNDTTATPGVPYYYRVAACLSTDHHCGDKGGPAVGIRKLAATASFTASDGVSDLHVALSWAAVTGAHAYNIFRKEGAGASAYLDYTPGTSFNDVTAFPGRLYGYYVQAYVSGYVEHDSVGDAGPTDTGYRLASPPTNIAASDGTYSDKVRISWTPANGDNLTYMIRRKVKDVIGGPITLASSLAGPPYDDASAASGVEYEYSVFSCVSPDGGSACTWLSDLGLAATTCNINMIPGGTESVDTFHEACEILTLGPYYNVASGANVLANSGWEIEFLSGFLVEQGATLEANVCGQSLCRASPNPMPDGCHTCVDRICDSDPTCCSLAFDQTCVDMVYSLCNRACEPE